MDIQRLTPKIVVKDTYKGKDTAVFYKPFKDENNNIVHLAGYAIDKNGKLVNTTFFDINPKKLKRYIEVEDSKLLFYKHLEDDTKSLSSHSKRVDITSAHNESIPQNPKNPNMRDGFLKLPHGGNDSKGFFDNNFGTLRELAKKESGKGWKDISQDNANKIRNIKNTVNRFFKDSFSGEYSASRELIHVNMQNVENKISNLTKMLGEFSPEIRKELHLYMTKQGGNDIPKEVKEVGDMVRSEISSLSQRLVDVGWLKKETHETWVDEYLYRMYEPKADKKGLSGMVNNFRTDKIHERGDAKEFTNAKDMIAWLNKNNIAKSDEILTHLGKEPQTEEIVRFLEDNALVGKINEGKVEVTDLGNKIKLRRDWTKTEREAMGEIEDASVTIPKTLLKLNKMIQNIEFLQRVKKIDGAIADDKLVKNLSKAELEKAGYRKLDGAEYGELNRQWVREDVEQDIKGLVKNALSSHTDFIQARNFYNSIFKKSKTVWSPTGHINNFNGNVTLMHLAGVNTSKILPTLKRGFKDINALHRIEDLEYKTLTKRITSAETSELQQLRVSAKYAIEAKEIGIFGRSQLNDILSHMEDSVAPKSMLSKVDSKLSDWYQGGDNFNRLSFYLTLRHNGESSLEAKKMVDFMLPDYSKPLPQGWTLMRDWNIAPFISWSYYTMPNIIKMAGTKQGAWKIASVIGALSVMENIATGGEVGLKDNLPFVSGNKPDDFKGRRFVYGKDGDNLKTIKLDRMIPYADLQAPVNYAISVFSGVLPNLAYTAQGREMYSGRRVTQEKKDTADKAIDWMKHLNKNYGLLPLPVNGAIDFADAKMRSKKKRRRNNVMQPRTTVQELLKNVGINTLTYNINKLKKERDY